MSAFWDGFEKEAEVGGRFMATSKKWGVGGTKLAGAARADRLLKALRSKPALLPTAHRAVRNLDLKNQMRGLATPETAARAALEKAKKVAE